MATNREVEILETRYTHAGMDTLDKGATKLDALGKAATAAGDRARDARGRFVGLGQGIDQAGDQIASAGTKVSAAATNMASSMAAAGGKMGRSGSFGSGLLMIGQFADDMQYGFRAVVGQVPGLVTALGGSMGVAGAISVVAVGVNQLINRWEALERLWDPGKVDRFAESIDGLTDKIEFLKKSTDGTVASTAELEKAQASLEKMQRDQAKFNAAKGQPTTAEAKSGAAFSEVVKESGGPEAIANMMAAALQKNQDYYNQKELTATKEAHDAMVKAQEEMRKGTDAQGNVPSHLYRAANDTREAYNKALSDADASARSRVEQTIGRAMSGNEKARLTIEDLANSNPRSFPTPVRMGFERSNPEFIKAQENAKAEYERIIGASDKADADLTQEMEDTARELEESGKAMRERREGLARKRKATENKTKREAADRQRDTERQAGQAAGAFGPPLIDALQQAIAMNEQTGRVNPEAHRAGLVRQVDQRLFAGGVLGDDGKPIGVEARWAAAEKIVAEAFQDLARKRFSAMQQQGQAMPGMMPQQGQGDGWGMWPENMRPGGMRSVGVAPPAAQGQGDGGLARGVDRMTQAHVNTQGTVFELQGVVDNLNRRLSRIEMNENRLRERNRRTATNLNRGT